MTDAEIPMPAQRHRSSSFELELAAFNLDDGCRISDCNAAAEELFGYARDQLIGQPIDMLFPELAAVDLIQNGEINSRLKFLSRLGRHFHGVNRAGESMACELFLNFLGNPGQNLISIIVRPATDGVGKRWADAWLNGSAVRSSPADNGARRE